MSQGQGIYLYSEITYLPPSWTREQLRSQESSSQYPTHDLDGPYLRDAHTVGLVVERGGVVIHISNLDIHLPRDHLERDVPGSTLPLPLGPLPTHAAQGPTKSRISPHRAIGSRGTLTPW